MTLTTLFRLHRRLLLQCAFVPVFLTLVFLAGCSTSRSSSSRNVSPTPSPAPPASRFIAGTPWADGQRGGLTTAQLKDFGTYPLFWLGDSYGGYNLQVVQRRRYQAPVTEGIFPPRPPTGDDTTLIYGSCAPPTTINDATCPAPIAVRVQPSCNLRMEWIADEVKDGPIVRVRGEAQEQKFQDGHVVIWTGKSAIGVWDNANPGGIKDVVDKLGAFANGPPAGKDLPAPDFSGCPK